MELPSLISGYSLCAQTEGKSKNTVAIITNSVSYLNDFLISEGVSNDVTQIGTREIRTFISHLQQKKCFSNHPFSKACQFSWQKMHRMPGFFYRLFFGWSSGLNLPTMTAVAADLFRGIIALGMSYTNQISLPTRYPSLTASIIRRPWLQSPTRYSLFTLPFNSSASASLGTTPAANTTLSDSMVR